MSKSPEDQGNLFLKLFKAFSKVRKQTLLRCIVDHSAVVLILLSWLPSLITASEKLALTDPEKSIFINPLAFGIAMGFFFVGFVGCESIVRFLINPYRN